jgi:hypothetical protein
MRYEVEITVTHRNDAGKIIRVDKAWGNDPLLQRFTHIGSEPAGARYKKAMRERQPLPIDPTKNYCPGEVSAILNCSYNTALRKMSRMKAVVNLGAKSHPGQRPKRILRISGRALSDFMRNRQGE